MAVAQVFSVATNCTSMPYLPRIHYALSHFAPRRAPTATTPAWRLQQHRPFTSVTASPALTLHQRAFDVFICHPSDCTFASALTAYRLPHPHTQWPSRPTWVAKNIISHGSREMTIHYQHAGLLCVTICSLWPPAAFTHLYGSIYGSISVFVFHRWCSFSLQTHLQTHLHSILHTSYGIFYYMT